MESTSNGASSLGLGRPSSAWQQPGQHPPPPPPPKQNNNDNNNKALLFAYLNLIPPLLSSSAPVAINDAPTQQAYTSEITLRPSASQVLPVLPGRNRDTK